MANTTYVYGCIEALGYFNNAEHLRYYRHNRRAIARLRATVPLYGEAGWPHMLRSMFTVHPFNCKPEYHLPAYEVQLISMAAAYKSLEGKLDEVWVEAFEQVLTTLYWSSAYIVTDCYGLRHQYKWYSALKHYDVYSPATQMPPRADWSRRCLQITAWEEIPWCEGLNVKQSPDPRLGSL